MGDLQPRPQKLDSLVTALRKLFHLPSYTCILRPMATMLYPQHDSSRWFRKTPTRPLIYGHRGAPQKQPENTLASFRTALAQGADGIEIDVRPCADGLVVFHDADLMRLVGRPQQVKDLTAAEMAAIDLGAGTGAPSLSATLSTVLAQPSARLNVEIKVDNKADRSSAEMLASRVCTLIQSRPRDEQERVIVSSFSLYAVETVIAKLGASRAALLLSENTGKWPQIPEHCAVNPHFSQQREAVPRFVAQSRIVNVWTVNDATSAVALAKLGVDSLITDDVPATLRALGVPDQHS